jgi:hypothetical protein
MEAWRRAHTIGGVRVPMGTNNAINAGLTVVTKADAQDDAKWEAYAFEDYPLPATKPGEVRPPTTPPKTKFPTRVSGLSSSDEAKKRAEALLKDVFPGHSCEKCDTWQQISK